MTNPKLTKVPQDTPTNAKTPEALFQKYSSALRSSGEIAVFALVTIFPLIFHDGYYDILETKYHCYASCILLLTGTVLFLTLLMAILDQKSFQGAHARALLSHLHPSRFKETFCAPDIILLAFWLTAVVSTLYSRFPRAALWGNEGRYCGLFLLTLYLISYFLVSRLFTWNKRFFDLFLASGILLCLFGITDYFQMDLLSLRGDSPTSLPSFTSTLGNINTYTAYVGMLLGFAAAMFLLENNIRKLFWYYLCFLIFMTAIILGRSDNAYLSLGTIYLFLPFVALTDRKKTWRYLILLATFSTLIWGIRIIDLLFANRTLGLYSLFRFLAGFQGLPILTIASWVLVAVFGIWYRKTKFKNSHPFGRRNLLPFVWGGFLFLAALVVCLLLFDANLAGHEERYAPLSSYLIFNDRWGSGRGYVWKKSLWLYRQLSPFGKLFGCGPDTFGCLVDKTIVLQMQNDTGMFFDNAHNSFLQYLVTLGFLGLGFYLLFLGVSFCRLFRNKGKNPYLFGILIATACYVTQSLVNLDVPVVTPIFWLLISIGISGCRKFSRSSSA